MTEQRDVTAQGFSITEALKCNVYVVTSKGPAPGYPRGDCFKCGEPLREHEIRVSALVPPGSTAYVIDEEALRV